MERSRASYVVLATLVVAALAMTVWVVGARHELRQVRATWAGAPACTGATVSPHADGWVIRARPGMSCHVTVEVTNDSGRDVHLDSVVAPGLGSMAGAVAVARTRTDTNPDGLDAELALDRVVPDGGSTRVTLEIGYRDRGCGRERGTVTLPDWPEVGVSLWQRSELLAADGTLYVRDLSGPCP